MHRIARLLVPALLCLFLFASGLSARTPDSLHVPALRMSFVDVGQGDAILLRSASGKTLLVDAGDTDGDAADRIRAHLKALGIRHLDAALITHPHDDHYGGFLHLVGKVSIGEMLYGTRGVTSRYRKLEAMCRDEGIPMRHVSKGEAIDLGPSVAIRVVHARGADVYEQWLSQHLPYFPAGTSIEEIAHMLESIADEFPQADVNGYSVVLQVRAEGGTCLLTGDATSGVENSIVSDGVARCDLLKVAHHGSRYSSTERFLAASRPATALIQVGMGNSFGHPHAEALRRLEKACHRIMRNDELGTIEAVSSSSGFVLSSEVGRFAEGTVGNRDLVFESLFGELD